MEVKNKTGLFQFESEIISTYFKDLYCLSKMIKSNFNVDILKNNYVCIINFNNINFKYSSVKSEINYYINNMFFNSKKYKDNINNYIDILNIDKNILNRNVSSLSSSEIYKLFVLLNVCLDKRIYVFNNIFDFLDKKNIKDILDLMSLLKQKNKIIIVNDNNIDNIYMNFGKIMLLDSNNFRFGYTKDLLTDKDILDEYGIQMPSLVEITYYAKENKNIKLFFHKDVRDIMKDIYKHV